MAEAPTRWRWNRLQGLASRLVGVSEVAVAVGHTFVFRPTGAMPRENTRAGNPVTWHGGQSSASRMTIRLIEAGDEALILNDDRRRALIGISRVVRAAYPAPTADEPNRLAIDLEPLRRLTPPLPFNRLRAESRLHGSALLRAPTPELVRLSAEERRILKRLGVG